MTTLNPIEMKALCASKLFAGYSVVGLAFLLDELGMRRQEFANNTILANENDPMTQMWVVLSGSVYLCAPDVSSGEHRIQSLLGEGDVVGATMIGSARVRFPATLIGHGKGVLASFSLAKMRVLQKQGREVRFFTNLADHLSEELIKTWKKCTILSCSNIAERVMMYLHCRVQDAGSNEVTIPSTEEAFANYLGVNRAALSRVLGQLRREGKIAYRRNTFTLLEKRPLR